MPTGLQVFNDSGVLQIDGAYNNLSFLRKGSSSVTEADPLPNLDATNCKIPFSPEDGEIVAVSWSETGNFIKYWTSPTEMGFKMNPPQGTLSYWVFGRTTYEGSDGLQVFSESGDLVFDSHRKPFRVADFIIGNDIRTYPSGRDYAIVFATQTFGKNLEKRLEPGGFYEDRIYTFYMTACSMEENSIDIKYFGYQRIWQMGLTPNPLIPQYTWDNGVTPTTMVIDVTGY